MYVHSKLQMMSQSNITTILDCDKKYWTAILIVHAVCYEKYWTDNTIDHVTTTVKTYI
jgi:hypothetical protein